MSAEDSEKKSFWTTLPGILTGMAAVLTALGGLLVILHSANLLGGDNAATPETSPKNNIESHIDLPKIERFDAIPSRIKAGDTSRLTWSVSDSDRVRIDPDIGNVALSGERDISPESSTTYTLSAENQGGTTDATATLTVILEETPSIHSSGQLTIDQTWTADLDEGSVGSDSGADIWFEAETATERYITPWGNVKLAAAGMSPPGFKGCRDAFLSRSRIDINELPVGSYICVLTNEGRHSQVRIDAPVGESPGTLEIDYITWGK